MPFFVFLFGIISNNLNCLGGLKKCIPKKFSLNSFDLPFTRLLIERPDVFVETIDSFFLFFSIISKTSFFIFSFSDTASIIQSQSFILFISSIMLPVLIL